MAVWSAFAEDRRTARYQPRVYNSAGNWHVFDVDEDRALTDDDLLRISVRRLIETPCRAPTSPAPAPVQIPEKRS